MVAQNTVDDSGNTRNEIAAVVLVRMIGDGGTGCKSGDSGDNGVTIIGGAAGMR